MEKIAYNYNDKLYITIPLRPIAEVIQNDIPEECRSNAVVVNSLPLSKYFRNAWEIDNNNVVVNMLKAREIKLNGIRLMRDNKLQELDKLEMEYFSKSDTDNLQLVREQKQALRDLPDTLNLEAYTTPESLENFIPEQLQEIK